MLIIKAFRDLSVSVAGIAAKYNVSDTYAMDTFDRYVKIDRLPLTDIISVDEVCLDLDPNCRYALIMQDFYTKMSATLETHHLCGKNYAVTESAD